MANSNGPFGLRAIRCEGAGCVAMEEMSIASGYGTNIFTGDPVEMTGTGTNVQISAAGNVDSIGVFGGCRYVDSGGNQQFSRYWPASTAATDVVALVYRDPYIIYEVQCDTLAATDIGALVDYDDTAGSTSTGNSGRSAVASATGTTGKALRLLRLVPQADNAYGAYAKAEVIFVEHVIKGVVSGVGGV